MPSTQPCAHWDRPGRRTLLQEVGASSKRPGLRRPVTLKRSHTNTAVASPTPAPAALRVRWTCIRTGRPPDRFQPAARVSPRPVDLPARLVAVHRCRPRPDRNRLLQRLETQQSLETPRQRPCGDLKSERHRPQRLAMHPDLHQKQGPHRDPIEGVPRNRRPGAGAINSKGRPPPDPPDPPQCAVIYHLDRLAEEGTPSRNPGRQASSSGSHCSSFTARALSDRGRASLPPVPASSKPPSPPFSRALAFAPTPIPLLPQTPVIPPHPLQLLLDRLQTLLQFSPRRFPPRLPQLLPRRLPPLSRPSMGHLPKPRITARLVQLSAHPLQLSPHPLALPASSPPFSLLPTPQDRDPWTQTPNSCPVLCYLFSQTPPLPLQPHACPRLVRTVTTMHLATW